MAKDEKGYDFSKDHDLWLDLDPSICAFATT